MENIMLTALLFGLVIGWFSSSALAADCYSDDLMSYVESRIPTAKTDRWERIKKAITGQDGGMSLEEAERILENRKRMGLFLEWMPEVVEAIKCVAAKPEPQQEVPPDTPMPQQAALTWGLVGRLPADTPSSTVGFSENYPDGGWQFYLAPSHTGTGCNMTGHIKVDPVDSDHSHWTITTSLKDWGYPTETARWDDSACSHSKLQSPTNGETAHRVFYVNYTTTPNRTAETNQVLNVKYVDEANNNAETQLATVTLKDGDNLGARNAIGTFRAYWVNGSVPHGTYDPYELSEDDHWDNDLILSYTVSYSADRYPDVNPDGWRFCVPLEQFAPDNDSSVASPVNILGFNEVEGAGGLACTDRVRGGNTNLNPGWKDNSADNPTQQIDVSFATRLDLQDNTFVNADFPIRDIDWQLNGVDIFTGLLSVNGVSYNTTPITEARPSQYRPEITKERNGLLRNAEAFPGTHATYCLGTGTAWVRKTPLTCGDMWSSKYKDRAPLVNGGCDKGHSDYVVRPTYTATERFALADEKTADTVWYPDRCFSTVDAPKYPLTPSNGPPSPGVGPDQLPTVTNDDLLLVDARVEDGQLTAKVFRDYYTEFALVFEVTGTARFHSPSNTPGPAPMVNFSAKEVGRHVGGPYSVHCAGDGPGHITMRGGVWHADEIALVSLNWSENLASYPVVNSQTIQVCN